jgi:cysteine desulfurase / selenocysteine lyase
MPSESSLDHRCDKRPEISIQIDVPASAARANDELEGFYRSAAALLGCQADEIAFAENATRAWDLAFYSIPFRPGDRVLTARAEYASNFIAYLQVARRTGAAVEVIPNDEAGQLSVAALHEMMDERVRLISITHVPSNGGLVNPAAEVGRVAREHGVPYLLDACQSVGQMPVDVQQIGYDFLSATGRKFLRGPRGTGFLYVRREAMERIEPVFLDLHAAEWIAPERYRLRPDARRFETWEQNVAGKLGLARAIDCAQEWGLEANRERVFGLAGTLRAALREVPGVSVEDLGDVRCGIVAFRVAGIEAGEIRERLAASRINVSVSDPSSPCSICGRGGSRGSCVHPCTTTTRRRRCRASARRCGPPNSPRGNRRLRETPASDLRRRGAHVSACRGRLREWPRAAITCRGPAPGRAGSSGR